MNAAAVFAVFALLAIPLFSGLALADPVKKSGPSKKAAGSTAVPISKRQKTANPQSKTALAHGGTSRTRQTVVTRKKVNGRWVRVTQVIRPNPGPSYQTHPDPERYQQIQQALATGGYFKGTVDGKWGDDSVAALKQFQTERNIPNDGKISALSLIGLGLGPNRETASAPLPAPVAPPAPPVPEAH